jgi:pimeloyl-ACP methyl ester carboxylesterase
MSTSPAGPAEPDLPPSTEELRAHLAAEPPAPDWSDRVAVVDHSVEALRPYASPSRPFDEAAYRDLVGREFDRATNIESSVTNHFVVEGGNRWRERLGEVSVPTLVVHGDEDPLFPLGHAEALARELHGARLLVLERTDRELPRETWNVVVPAIPAHTSVA